MMPIEDIPITREENSDIIKKLSILLVDVEKPYLATNFQLVQFHLDELNCVMESYIKPIIENIFQEKGIISNLPEDLTKDLYLWKKGEYLENINLLVQTKLFFFIARECIDEILTLINKLFGLLAEENKNPSPTDFSKFVTFINREDRVRFKTNIEQVLKKYLPDLIILRFIRNKLKKDGLLLFDIGYRSGKYRIEVLFEFGSADGTMDGLIKTGKFEILDNYILFDLENTLKAIFNIIIVMNSEIIRTILATEKGE